MNFINFYSYYNNKIKAEIIIGFSLRYFGNWNFEEENIFNTYKLLH